MRCLKFILLVFFPFVLMGQSGISPISDSVILVKKWNQEEHHQIQPMIRQTKLNTINNIDSINKWRFLPVTESYIQQDRESNFRSTLGIGFEYIGKQLYNRTSYTVGWSTSVPANQIHPSFPSKQTQELFIYHDLRTRFGFTPNKMLHISGGLDNQFIGEGYHSLLEGDQVAPSPFAMLRARFWHLEYGLFYQFLREYDSSTTISKYKTSHYLSWNATRNWNITLYETVLFQPKDGTYQRGFEVEYLNPFVFFRPQEYSIGSTDNVLMGLNTAIKLGKHVVYYQMSLDEFLLEEIRKRSGWWANKYGVQLGIKGKIKTVAYRLEGNIVRPYTYSHINIGQNVGHLGQAIGHRLGSNFAQLLFMVDFPIKKLYFKTYAVFFLKGYDEDEKSWGGDLYKSYVSHPKEYENTIGQGVTQRTLQLGGELSYRFNKSALLIYCQFGVIQSWGDLKSTTDPLVNLGIRSTLFGPRRLF